MDIRRDVLIRELSAQSTLLGGAWSNKKIGECAVDWDAKLPASASYNVVRKAFADWSENHRKMPNFYDIRQLIYSYNKSAPQGVITIKKEASHECKYCRVRLMRIMSMSKSEAEMHKPVLNASLRDRPLDEWEQKAISLPSTKEEVNCFKEWLRNAFDNKVISEAILEYWFKSNPYGVIEL